MAQRNGIQTRRLQITVDETTERLISDMIELGIHGANKAEVGSFIIRQWIWENQERLQANGVYLRKATQAKDKGSES